jgi:methionine-rich copper-binding protein CopC
MQKIRHFVTVSTALMLGLGLMLVFAVGTASAHAKVISSTPGMGQTVATAPTSVSVTTAENMNPDPKKSNLFVYSPAGDLISQGDAKIPLNNPKEMSVPIKATGNGIYVVRWITVSADDGDAAEGAFTFTVNPAGNNAATGVEAKPTAAPAASSATTTQNSSPVIPAVITGIIALLVGLGAGFGFGRTRPAPATSATSAKPEDKITSK